MGPVLPGLFLFGEIDDIACCKYSRLGWELQCWRDGDIAIGCEDSRSEGGRYKICVGTWPSGGQCQVRVEIDPFPCFYLAFVNRELVDEIVEDEVDSVITDIFLNCLTKFIWVCRVEELLVSVNDRHGFLGPEVFDLSSIL